MGASMQQRIASAAILVIGDEILSGRTKDKNVGYIADYLTRIGIDLKEVRIVPDEQDRIVEALNALRSRWTYVFTTGGIGPTHDDITADAVAAAFGVGISHDPRAVAILQARYKPEDLNEARLRMARLPDGAELIFNPISQAPGFRVGNVFVMAGVPSIMQAMFDGVAPLLEGGVPMLMHVADRRVKEGDIGTPLGEIAKRHPEVMIGSYPYFTQDGFFSKIVCRARDQALLDAAVAEVEALLAQASSSALE